MDDQWKLQALSSDGYTGGTELVTVTVTVQWADATTVRRNFIFNVIITCVATTITSQLNPTYTYVRGDPLFSITRPSVIMNDCTVCTVTDNTPVHAWWTSATDFVIYTDDPTLIGTQNKVTFTDVDI